MSRTTLGERKTNITKLSTSIRNSCYILLSTFPSEGPCIAGRNFSSYSPFWEGRNEREKKAFSLLIKLAIYRPPNDADTSKIKLENFIQTRIILCDKRHKKINFYNQCRHQANLARPSAWQPFQTSLGARRPFSNYIMHPAAFPNYIMHPVVLTALIKATFQLISSQNTSNQP